MLDIDFGSLPGGLKLRMAVLMGWLRSIHAYKEGRLLRVIPYD